MEKTDCDLINLPNIGKKLADKLILVGIKSSKDLRFAGAESAFIKLVTVEKDLCINTLYAIEGAVQGIRWHDLSDERKKELREFYAIANK